MSNILDFMNLLAVILDGFFAQGGGLVGCTLPWATVLQKNLNNKRDVQIP
jgi:hypothetical protein